MEFVILLYLFEEEASWCVPLVIAPLPVERRCWNRRQWPSEGVTECGLRTWSLSVRGWSVAAYAASVSVTLRGRKGLQSRHGLPQCHIVACARVMDAHRLVKVTSIFSLLLGVFKIIKSLRVRRRDEAKSDGTKSLTDEIDRLAFRYLSPPLLLLVVAYSGVVMPRQFFRHPLPTVINNLLVTTPGAIDCTALLLLAHATYAGGGACFGGGVMVAQCCARLCLHCASGYSLYTGYHRGWYAWLIDSIVALVYGGGFIVVRDAIILTLIPRIRSPAWVHASRWHAWPHAHRLVDHTAIADDAATLHQLSTEIGRTLAVEVFHVQGAQHVHR